MNPVNGVVGVFNVQGSSWSRKKRAFHTHDPSPPLLETLVNPTDINTFAQSSSAPQHFVMYSDQARQFALTAHQRNMTVTLKAGKSDVVTIAPVFGIGSEVQVACIGFVNMLNPGAGVLKVKLDQGQSGRRNAVCEMVVKGCGELLMYVSKAPLQVSASGQRLAHTHDTSLRQLSIQLPVAPDLQRTVQVEL